MLITAYCVFLSLHFLAYLAIFRLSPVFASEKTIFLYHFSSFLLLCSIFMVKLLADPTLASWLQLLFVVCSHGIYSLSFLEIWSLAQGGYSLRILMELEEGRKTGADVDLGRFTDIGQEKRASRLDGLRKLRLLWNEGEVIRLTWLGAMAAIALSTVAWLANLKNEG